MGSLGRGRRYLIHATAIAATEGHTVAASATHSEGVMLPMVAHSMARVMEGLPVEDVTATFDGENNSYCSSFPRQLVQPL